MNVPCANDRVVYGVRVARATITRAIGYTLWNAMRAAS